MSLVEQSYVLAYQSFEGEEKDGTPEQLAFFFLSRLLSSDEAREIILDRDKKNRTITFHITTSISNKNVKYKVSSHKRKGHDARRIIICFNYKYRNSILSIHRDYFKVDFKKFSKLDPMITLKKLDNETFGPDFDIYKTNDKYKFRFPCSNPNCLNRESLTSKFSRCSKCLRVRYCSRDYQKKPLGRGTKIVVYLLNESS